MNAEPLDESEDLLAGLCADLVSHRKHEAFLRHLLTERGPGEWVRVGEVTTGLSATWLPAPPGSEGYALILFYDDASGWSTTALYNRDRLLAGVRDAAVGQSSLAE